MKRVQKAPDVGEKRLEFLMETYGTDVKRVCYLFLRDGELARDAAQETFIRAWRALDQLRDEGAEKAWLLAIAANVCRKMLKSRDFRMVERGISPETLPEKGKSDEMFDDTVLTEVMKLDGKYRQAIVLHYYQGLSCEETARALNVPGATVRTRLMRAREILRSRLKG